MVTVLIISATNMYFGRKRPKFKRCHQDRNSHTNIWKLSPTLSHQHHCHHLNEMMSNWWRWWRWWQRYVFDLMMVTVWRHKEHVTNIPHLSPTSVTIINVAWVKYQMNIQCQLRWWLLDGTNRKNNLRILRLFKFFWRLISF